MSCRNTYGSDVKLEDRAILHVDKEHQFSVFE